MSESNSFKKRKTSKQAEQQQLDLEGLTQGELIEGAAATKELLSFVPRDSELDDPEVSKRPTPPPVPSYQSTVEPRKLTPREHKLLQSRNQLVHTGPSIRTIQAIQDSAQELCSTVQKLYTAVDRIQYLTDKTIEDQLGLYKARYALESTYAESGVAVEDISVEDRNGNELTRNDIVRTVCDHDRHTYCYGKVVRITGIVVLIELSEQRRVIGRLSHECWIVTNEVIEASHQLEEEIQANEQLNQYLTEDHKFR